MNPSVKIDTLIISDVHLGSIVSRAGKLAELLRATDFKRLILLGDIFDNSKFDHLSEENWALLTLIRKLADPKDGREVVWLRGNHDKRVADLMSYMTGAKVYDQYIWEFHNKRFLAIHGDRFDEFSLSESLIGRLGQKFFTSLQHLDKEGRHIVRLLDRSHESLRRLSEKVADGAIDYAKVLKADYVFCGHTHIAMEKVLLEKTALPTQHSTPIHYYNVGCWTRSPSTFATIKEDGTISLGTVK